MPYTPHEHQLKLHRSKAKVKWNQTGRRGGKTRSALEEDLAVIEDLSHKYVNFAHEPGKLMTAEEARLVPAIHVWTVAPTKAQMYQVWNEMQAFIPEHLVSKTNPYRDNKLGGGRGSGFKEDALHVWLVFKDRNDRWLKGRDGKRRPRPVVFWELKSADNPDSLQSVGLDVLHITEAQEIAEIGWNKLRPTLSSPGRAGRALIEGIPPTSPSHWFARNFKRAKNSPSRRREAFSWTAFENPLLTEDQKEEIMEDKETMMEDDWNRLYMAIQPEGVGAFFRKVDKAMIGTELLNPNSGDDYVAGLDLGRSNDATVLIVKNRRTRESVSATELLKTDWTIQMAVILSEARRWNLRQIVMDSTGLGGLFARDIMYNEMLQEGIPVVAFNFTPVSKYHDLFLPYRVALEHEQVSFPPEWNKLSTQLMDISHRETVNRGHVFSTLSGKYDDWVDAETLALYGCDPVEYAHAKKLTKQSSGMEPLRPNYTGSTRNRRSSYIDLTRKARHREYDEHIDTLIEAEKISP
jgi:hypothetical protein|tara:strand:- start:3198 stop:4760 length:1563 start_codon:yes stop_codon:yes gene_type:complete